MSVFLLIFEKRMELDLMTFIKQVTLLLVFVVVGCTASEEVFDIRSSDRPEYTKTLSAENIRTFIDKGGILVDVRLEEDFTLDPRLISGAFRGNPDQLENWINGYKNKPIAVYCVKGKWVSQKAANHIAKLGFETYSLEGGLSAYDEYMRAK